jgi:hypothetical protein
MPRAEIMCIDADIHGKGRCVKEVPTRMPEGLLNVGLALYSIRAHEAAAGCVNSSPSMGKGILEQAL